MVDRCAGVLVPLFALRVAGDFGRGDIAALPAMGRFAHSIGHHLIMLLPLDETAGAETSPYAAMSVLAIDPAYVSAADLPGVSGADCQISRRHLAGSNLQPELLAIRSAKRQLLERSYRHFCRDADRALRESFAAFIDRNCAWLHDYALFAALKEKYGNASWDKWPDRIRRHDPRAIADAKRQLAEQIRMFQYFQFAVERQWHAVREQFATSTLLIGGDLAFSPGRDSAEVWANQEFFDSERCVGAPPDAFSITGQRWGLPMPNWKRFRESGFAFLRTRVRRARQLFDVLRIDHVVGLFRTYGYLPGDEDSGGFTPSEEPAQQAQGAEILRVILEEAGPMQIVAEDLGVIPPFVRATLAALGVPGYRVARWERQPPEGPERPFLNVATYPENSLATTGTHDTETLAEWWSLTAPDERRKFLRALALDDTSAAEAPTLSENVLDAILEGLYRTPSRLVVVPMQDLFGWKERVNIPGTTGAHNWTWRLPFELDRVANDTRLRRRCDKLRRIAERTGRF